MWLALVAANLVLLLAPGPTMLLIIGTTLQESPRAALATVGGVAIGLFGTVTAALAGFGTLLLAVPWCFKLVQVVGAAYLVFLGIGALRRSAAPARRVPPPSAGSLAFCGRGFITEVANPKPLLFYAAFIPQFVDPSQPMGPQFALVATTIVLQGLMFDVLCVVLAAHGRTKVTGFGRVRMLDRLAGVCLLGGGTAMLVLVD
jgi:threonine/homoserine/homoserine lactone efflux protein